MNNRQYITMVAVSMLSLASVYGADITNGGSVLPPQAYSIAQVTSSTGDTGTRGVEWKSSTVHSVSGQSFLATKTATAGTISLFLTSSENFSGYDVDSIELKIFEGDHITRNAVAVGSYVYDPTVLGDGVQNVWIEFGLGAGIPMVSGNVYSFMLCFNSEKAAHTFFFKRAKSSPLYADGEELRGGNLYDIVNWSTDPWDDVAPIGSSVAASGGDLFFSVNELISGNIAPTADDIEKSTLLNTPVDLLLSGSDVNGDSLTFSVQDPPTNGWLTGTVPNLTYNPSNDVVGADSFTYIANDGTTNSAPATVSISVLSESGIMSSVGATDPSVANTNLVGTAVAGAERQIIRTDSQSFMIGQSFTLSKKEVLSEIYLNSANTKDLSSFVGGVEIKVFSGEGAAATLVHTSIFDATVNDQEGNDVTKGDWVRFSLQGGGVDLPAGANSFLVFWTQKANGNIWAFNRNKSDSYAGGIQYEFAGQSGDAYPQWDTNPWSAVTAIAANDLTFFLNSIESVLTPSEVYEAWATESGANADMTIDTDFDGMDDLLEYALGGDPTTNDAAAILPVSEEVGGWMYYIYNQRDDAADRGLTYEVLSSVDLVNGPITNATTYVGTSVPANGFETVTNGVPTSTEGSQFMKLRVELAD